MNNEQQMNGNIIPRATIEEQVEEFAAKWQGRLGDTGGDLARDLALMVDVILTEQEEMISEDIENVDISIEFVVSVTELAAQACDEEQKELFQQLARLESGEPATAVPILRRIVALMQEEYNLEKVVRRLKRELKEGEKSPRARLTT